MPERLERSITVSLPLEVDKAVFVPPPRINIVVDAVFTASCTSITDLGSSTFFNLLLNAAEIHYQVIRKHHIPGTRSAGNILPELAIPFGSISLVNFNI